MRPRPYSPRLSCKGRIHRPKWWGGRCMRLDRSTLHRAQAAPDNTASHYCNCRAARTRLRTAARMPPFRSS
jgi:hypothetical protein